MRKFLLGTVLLLIIVTSIQLWVTRDQTSQKHALDQVSTQPEAQIGGNFTLTDQDGKIVHDTDFHGHIMLVYFGFTQCPDACPLTLMLVTKAMALLGEKAEEVTPLFITVDPEHDTPDILKNYLSNFDRHIIGLTGTPEQIKQVEDMYKVYAAKKEGSDQFDHSSYMYVMGKGGAFLTVIPSSVSEQELVQTLQKYVSQ